MRGVELWGAYLPQQPQVQVPSVQLPPQPSQQSDAETVSSIFMWVFLLLEALVNVRRLQAERGKSRFSVPSNAAAGVRPRWENAAPQIARTPKSAPRRPARTAFRRTLHPQLRAPEPRPQRSSRRARFVRSNTARTTRSSRWPFAAGNNTASHAAPPRPATSGATTNQATTTMPRSAKFCPNYYARGEYDSIGAFASN